MTVHQSRHLLSQTGLNGVSFLSWLDGALRASWQAIHSAMTSYACSQQAALPHSSSSYHKQRILMRLISKQLLIAHKMQRVVAKVAQPSLSGLGGSSLWCMQARDGMQPWCVNVLDRPRAGRLGPHPRPRKQQHEPVSSRLMLCCVTGMHPRKEIGPGQRDAHTPYACTQAPAQRTPAALASMAQELWLHALAHKSEMSHT